MYTVKLAVAVVVAGAAVVLAGCGGSSPSRTATSTGGSPKSMVGAAYRFSRCMREHGLPNFPDPKVTTSEGHQSVALAVTPSDTGSPQFKTAQKACSGILPAPPSRSDLAAQARQRAQNILSFVRCLRAHGITRFPDPNPQGQLTLQMVQAAGVDLHAPGVRSAGLACVSASHGAVTPADIAQATGTG